MQKEKKAKIGLGLITYNRPKYFKVAIQSVLKHLDMLDEIVVYRDGGNYEDQYTRIMYDYAGKVTWINKKDNQGVAAAKNFCLKALTEMGCDYLFLMEDDIEVLDRKAVVSYLAAHKMTGYPHLLWAHHGDNNVMNAIVTKEALPLVFWPNCVGAFNFYTREAIEQVGYFDENFKNAYEHVEHSWRIFKEHLTYGWWPDVMDSQLWLREQPGALENSSIRDPDGNWQKRISEALAYWRSKDPDCPAKDPNWEADHKWQKP